MQPKIRIYIILQFGLRSSKSTTGTMLCKWLVWRVSFPCFQPTQPRPQSSSWKLLEAVSAERERVSPSAAEALHPVPRRRSTLGRGATGCWKVVESRMLTWMMSQHMDMQSRTTLFCNSLFEQSCTYFPCYQSAVWSGKCRVWSVECKVRSVKCKVWSGECRVCKV